MAEKKNLRRITVRVDEDTYKRVEYWAARRQCSVSEYLADAIDHMIKYENGDYDLPNLEQKRLNQIIDTLTVLSANTQSLEDVVINGFSSLLGLTRGDNYLLDQEDGEI